VQNLHDRHTPQTKYSQEFNFGWQGDTPTAVLSVKVAIFWQEGPSIIARWASNDLNLGAELLAG